MYLKPRVSVLKPLEMTAVLSFNDPGGKVVKPVALRPQACLDNHSVVSGLATLPKPLNRHWATLVRDRVQEENSYYLPVSITSRCQAPTLQQAMTFSGSALAGNSRIPQSMRDTQVAMSEQPWLDDLVLLLLLARLPTATAEGPGSTAASEASEGEGRGGAIHKGATVKSDYMTSSTRRVERCRSGAGGGERGVKEVRIRDVAGKDAVAGNVSCSLALEKAGSGRGSQVANLAAGRPRPRPNTGLSIVLLWKLAKRWR
ncbi:uncharacterized protein BDR25DRAFT_319910 [Lindgomyces ingoldianus]|uniref:Uncharacterized protein n=1 Tax=Lindgomyces ingoldianus TaxID=673940 RepID=A0ACB6QAY7_9PLEO|nr:uncharacterized protein BDR25DRAFT_319910 [Lindgomyces ingoldianus]KAF2463542.1 hypothetical protein BDR25DRAFT_319910 [Lindgomyces ingoldianus]